MSDDWHLVTGKCSCGHDASWHYMGTAAHECSRARACKCKGFSGLQEITIPRADFDRLVAAAEDVFRITGPTWPTAGEANAVDELDAALAPFRKEKT